MSWILRCKPRPSCLRDRLEVWYIRSNGYWYRVNLAGFIPYAGVPVCAAIGYVISFTMSPDPYLSWEEWQRYVPVLLGFGTGAIGGLVVRACIIGEFYKDDPPQRDQKDYERLLSRMRADERGKPKRKRPKSVDEI